MDNLRAAAVLALEALETKGEHHERVYAAIAALRQALAQPEQECQECDGMGFQDGVGNLCSNCFGDGTQPEQEPVAWYYADSDVEIHSVALSEDLDDDQKANCIPLYTAPPSKPWISLTSEELASIVVEHAGFPTRQLAAIEAKLKGRNT